MLIIVFAGDAPVALRASQLAIRVGVDLLASDLLASVFPHGQRFDAADIATAVVALGRPIIDVGSTATRAFFGQGAHGLR